MTSSQDTIVAVATAPGKGGIGIVRLSGAGASAIAKHVLPEGTTLLPRHAHFSPFIGPDKEQIDEGIVLFFPGPNSFTGEDVIEFQGHGGPVILDQVVRQCIAHGARHANAGEFSLRAYLNDRIDLTQAEAIADLIDAGSEAAAKAAMHSLQGDFSKEVNRLIDALIQLRMYVEAAIDFPEEEIDFLSDGKVSTDLNNLIITTERVLATARQGRLLREGMTVVIAGRPNAGKSSLLNALAGHDAAIVTDIAGTTRDVLRETIQIDGMPINIIDTAGLRESPDVVEREGIRRAWAEIERADILLVLADASQTKPHISSLADVLPDDEARLARLDVPMLLVLNKTDLVDQSQLPKADMENIAISAKNGTGIDQLREKLKKGVGYQSTSDSRFSARRRHLTALEYALDALRRGASQLIEHQAGELLAEDLRAAQQAMEEITGAFSADDLLGKIFSSFCIGK
ncbi:MAG: tRNA uridine-5-carboxymethylaminomethyl(34) synthesis GTPase MnmE [Alcanivoracaceae bacterium]|nr:tRNA uridine-5-carboxymethylaminomethyl(34) synthesis GTPase MnmE [Alcanivoracaceae bacterium]